MKGGEERGRDAIRSVMVMLDMEEIKCAERRPVSSCGSTLQCAVHHP